MRGKTISPAGKPLVSISVSLVALRLLLKVAEPRLAGKSPGVSAFVGPGITEILQNTRRRKIGFLPWVHAHPIEAPIINTRPPRVLDVPEDTTMPADSKISARLWDDCQLEAMQSLHHPWTLGLASGSASRTSFKAYVAQDAYFLKAFAQAYAHALTKTSDEEGIRAFHSLIGSVLDELTLHASYANKWGIDIHNVPPPVKATSDYVSFLLAVASDPSSSIAQVLASMAPCMRLYSFLGKELRQAFPRWGESAYAHWIETYSSQEFEEAAALLESLLDKYSEEANYTYLLNLYRKAMRLEYAFFAAHDPRATAEDDRPVTLKQAIDTVADSVIQRAADGVDIPTSAGVHERVALLCVDFDDTLTDGDTTNLLVKAAQEQRDTAVEKEEVARRWEILTNIFFTSSNDVIKEELDTKLKEAGGAADQCGPIDREGLEKLLRRLEKVDLDSVTRVSEDQVLRGITRKSVQASLSGPLRSSWKLRPSMGRCLSRALASPFVTHVVSVNWSRDVIASVLSEAIPAKHGMGILDDDWVAAPTLVSDEMCGSQHGKFQSIPVSSNDLVYDRHGVSTGEIDIRIPGSSGKHRCFRDLAIMARETAGDSEHTGVSMSGQRSLTVFVGDSVTDLLAMLDADIGIVVGSSGTFAKVATAFGIPIRPLAAAHEALGGKRGETCDRGLSEPDNCIYRVSNWAEIDAFLFGGA